MILAKLYTEEEGGKWAKCMGSLEKQIIIPLINRGHVFKFTTESGLSDWHSIMFSDGTIYDRDKGFRSETDFPKDETIDYMNKILNGEIA